MARVTFQVLEGVDKGRVFHDLAPPFTIGREEGNLVRLNDERISRFHAKVQQDQGDMILTDLESTNGTRVNGKIVQIRRLRYGDCVAVGRSVLLFGSNEEIAARLASLCANSGAKGLAAMSNPVATVQAPPEDVPVSEADLEFELDDQVKVTDGELFIGNRTLPPLPQQLTPSQAARLAEIFDFLHRGLLQATEKIQESEDGRDITLDVATWQKILAVGIILARYVRGIAEPESLENRD